MFIFQDANGESRQALLLKENKYCAVDVKKVFVIVNVNVIKFYFKYFEC